MARFAVISFHTSPLAQPGTGDGGGMNVYVRELARELSARGHCVDIFTRSQDPAVPHEFPGLEIGARVFHISTDYVFDGAERRFGSPAEAKEAGIFEIRNVPEDQLQPIIAIALVRCVSRVRSAVNAITTAEIAPAPCRMRPAITPPIESAAAAIKLPAANIARPK